MVEAGSGRLSCACGGSRPSLDSGGLVEERRGLEEMDMERSSSSIAEAITSAEVRSALSSWRGIISGRRFRMNDAEVDYYFADN